MCDDCAARRAKFIDALLSAKIAEAVRQAALGVREIVAGKGPRDGS
jgi:hypothetical protein